MHKASSNTSHNTVKLKEVDGRMRLAHISNTTLKRLLGRGAVACVLALAGILLLVSAPTRVYAAPASGTAQSHLDKAEEARKKAAAEEANAKRLAKEVEELEIRVGQYAKEAESYQPKIKEASGKASALAQELSRLKSAEASLRAEIERTSQLYEEQKERLRDRAAETYRQGEDFYLSLLFESVDLSDLITRSEFVSRILQENSETADALMVTKRTLDNNRVELEKTVATAKEKSDAAAAVANRLITLKASRIAAVNSSEALQDKKSDLMKDSKENAARLRALAEAEEAEARKLQKELSGSGSGKFSGKMAWPVPGFTRVSSPFGYRIHPIFGTRKLHTGIDIGRKSDGTSINGAAIVAAGSGKVISAGSRSGYGYTVIIDHGNGVTTLYAHQQAGGIKVSNGQNVKAGQRIGTVGSTGNSTGPHLHWEVRVNGTPVNPMTY